MIKALFPHQRHIITASKLGVSENATKVEAGPPAVVLVLARSSPTHPTHTREIEELMDTHKEASTKRNTAH